MISFLTLDIPIYNVLKQSQMGIYIVYFTKKSYIQDYIFQFIVYECQIAFNSKFHYSSVQTKALKVSNMKKNESIKQDLYSKRYEQNSKLELEQKNTKIQSKNTLLIQFKLKLLFTIKNTNPYQNIRIRNLKTLRRYNKLVKVRTKLKLPSSLGPI